ncbi:MAG: molecular chaperone TorD family protein [Nitrospirae bacterium]|nr:molecular chaperone TorD family protein [Nitrospirota bacterium]
MNTAEGAIYTALSECYKDPGIEFAGDVVTGRLYELIATGFQQLSIPVAEETILNLWPTNGDENIPSPSPSPHRGEGRGEGDRLKEDYYSLFFPLYVVPVESVYKEWTNVEDVTGAMKGEKGYIMGDPAIEMLHRYKMLGIEIPQVYKDTPDHIALLLEYASLLCENVYREERAGFVLSHLGWVEDLRDDIYKYSESIFYRAVADITVAFLQYERANLMSLR